jgi:hypothetical protein
LSIRIDCPLCDWHMTEEGQDVSPDALASVFGIGVMAAIARNDRLEKTERTLREHLSTHSLAEWVRKVADLQAEVSKLTGAP